VVIAIGVLATVGLLAQPSPPPAKADPVCDVATGPVGAVTGAIGLGNPAGDACNTVTGGIGAVGGAITSPVTGALKGIGNSVFEQLTSWTAEGAAWLMGQVVEAIDSSTTPRLDTEGFLRAYGRMAAIAAVLAAAMLLLAILEGIAQGNSGLLVRVVLVNVPLAFLGTSLAFAVVQLLLACTDGLCAAIANASHHDSTRFFEAAIGDLGHVGGEVGKQAGEAAGEKGTGGLGGEAAGTVAVPLFVGFLAAIVGAFAAFFVWLELLMRDAAVYAVALFMPLALAASIWPRWTGAMRRTGELMVAVIGSKFVIVAIVSLAASLIAEDDGSVEHVLAASALMCLACFAPFVLLRLIPFSEGALAAAYGRRSAASTTHHGAAQFASNAQMVRSMGRSSEGSGVSLWSTAEGGGSPGGKSGGQGPGAGTPGGPFGGGKGSSGGAASSGAGAGAEAGGTAAAAGSPAAAAAAPVAAAKAPKAAAGRLEQTANAQGAGSGSEGQSGGGGEQEPASRGAGQRAQTEASSQPGAGEAGGSPPSPGERPPRPTSDTPPPGERPPRPTSDAAPPGERPPRPAADPPGPKGEQSGGKR
jgi:hypothetical protein